MLMLRYCVNSGRYDPMLDLPSYQFPNIDLLNEVIENQHEKVSQEELESNKTKIVDTLGSYGINISKIKATIGPTVTLYEIIPEAGGKDFQDQKPRRRYRIEPCRVGYPDHRPYARPRNDRDRSAQQEP